MFTLIHFDMGICFYLYELKMKNFQNFIYNIYKKLWGDDIINSLIWIFIRTGQEMFCEKNVKFQIVISSLFLIQFSSFFHCSLEFFLLFLLKLILEWISPLRWTHVVLYNCITSNAVKVRPQYIRNSGSRFIKSFINCVESKETWQGNSFTQGVTLVAGREKNFLQGCINCL